MKSVSMLEFRKNALAIVQSVRRGQRILLTYRGEPVARLEPPDAPAGDDDPFYALADLAAAEGESLTNREIDEILYGR